MATGCGTSIGNLMASMLQVCIAMLMLGFAFVKTKVLQHCTCFAQWPTWGPTAYFAYTFFRVGSPPPIVFAGTAQASVAKGECELIRIVAPTGGKGGTPNTT